MAAAYDQLAETRPRMQRDVLFTRTDDGVLFHNSKGGFHVNGKTAYQFTELLVPHLDGTRQVKDICAGLGEQQRSMVTTLLSTLFDRRFVRDVPGEDDSAGVRTIEPPVRETFDVQINYIDHYADAAVRRFTDFRTAAVAVLGTDTVAEQCVLGLVRNGAGRLGFDAGLIDSTGARAQELSTLDAAGCPVEIHRLATSDPTVGWQELVGYDVVLVAGEHAPAQLHRLERDGVPEGVVVIGAWVFGERAIVGPMLTSGHDKPWTSAVLRLGANVSAVDEAAIWAGVLAPEVGPHDSSLAGPLGAMLGNLLAYESFRHLTGALEAETRGALIIQDRNSLDTGVEPLFTHPAWVRGDDAESVPATSATKSVHARNTALNSEDPDLLALQEREVLVNQHTGVFKGYTDEPWKQMPLKVSSVLVNPTRSVSRDIMAYDVQHVAAARLRALEAGALVYTNYVAEVAGVLRGEALETARSAAPEVDPRELTVATGTTAAREDGMVRGHVVTSDETVLVPATAVQPLLANRMRCTQATSAGQGAGQDESGAREHGLATALAHRALLLALRGATRVVRLDRSQLGANDTASDTTREELRFLLRSVDTVGSEIELLDLGEEGRSGAQVVFARSRGNQPFWTVACGRDHTEAARDALRDLLGAIQLSGDPAAPEGRVDPGNSLLPDLDPLLVPVDDEGAPSRARTEWEHILAALGKTGTDVIHIRTTPPDLAAGGIETAQVFLWTRSGGN